MLIAVLLALPTGGPHHRSHAKLEHLLGHPSVAKGLEAGTLRLHGWVYDFERGDVYACDENGSFSKV